MLAGKGNIAAIVCSPLGRARETAEAAGQALGLPVRVLDGLIETDFGAWEGLTFTEAAEHDPELHARWLGDPSIAPPNGESFDQVRERIEGVRRDLVALHPGANVLVVSHVTPIKMLLQLALGVGPRCCTACTWIWHRCPSPSSTPTAAHRSAWPTTPHTCENARGGARYGRSVAVRNSTWS